MLVNIVKTGQNAAGTAHATAVFSEPPSFAVNGESFDFGLRGGGGGGSGIPRGQVLKVVS